MCDTILDVIAQSMCEMHLTPLLTYVKMRRAHEIRVRLVFPCRHHFNRSVIIRASDDRAVLGYARRKYLPSTFAASSRFDESRAHGHHRRVSNPLDRRAPSVRWVALASHFDAAAQRCVERSNNPLNLTMPTLVKFTGFLIAPRAVRDCPEGSNKLQRCPPWSFLKYGNIS